MNDMAKHKRSLETAKGKDVSKRAKPLVSGVGYMKKRKPYKNGGEVSK